MTVSDLELRPLISQPEIEAKIAELGGRISHDYRGQDLMIVGVLRSAAVLIADLSRALSIHAQVEIVAASSRGWPTSNSGVIRIGKSLDVDIRDRHVLIAETVVDTGVTLSYLLKNFRTRQPASLNVCALMTKPGISRDLLNIKYHGFAIPSQRAVGYGLDHEQRHRNLPYVCTLRPPHPVPP